MVGADDGVAGVGLHVVGFALAGMRQGIGQGLQVFGILVVVAQVQFHPLRARLLRTVDVAECVVDGRLPQHLLPEWQDDIDIHRHHVLPEVG